MPSPDATTWQADDADAARLIRKWFEQPKPERREKPWSRLQLEVRREFFEAQRWGRR